jgi:hypothetical protein
MKKRRHFSLFWSFPTPSSWATCCNNIHRHLDWLLSSSTYSSEICPEPALRRYLLASGWTIMLIGVVPILSLPFGEFWCAAAASLWCAIVSAQLGFISSAHKRFSRIRIGSDGECQLCDQNGDWQKAKMRGGCVVLPRLAWLRLQPCKGHCYYALIRGDSRESKQWRRLQVIWRHLGRAR